MPDELFGQLNSFHDVELALQTHVKNGLNTYLAARERAKGLTAGAISRPTSWLIKQSFMALPGEDRLPAIIIVSPGFTEPPAKHGDGGYDVYLGMAVVALVSGPGQSARMLAGHYQSALNALLIKHKKFGAGSARIHEWLDLALDDVDTEDQTRNLAAARLEFVVKVTDFVSSDTRIPVIPAPDPLPPQPDGPEVLTHNEEVAPI